jgi:hypothetical protein
LLQTGWVRVAGADLVGAEVRVDGVARGSAPARMELAVGPHAVNLVLRDGRHVAPIHIEVRPANTHSAPLDVRLPSP